MIFEQLGATPIQPDAPAGADVKAEPDFDALEAEIGKLTNPAATSPINWQQVVDLSGGLLANKGKDLRVACYLAFALTQTRKIEGLNIGFKILADMLSTFWDSMYPPKARLRGRRNAIEWWLERTTTYLRSLQVDPLPLEEISQLKQRLAQIDGVLKEKDPEGPALEPLISTIRGFPAEEVKSAIPAATADGAAPAESQNPNVLLRDSTKNIQSAVTRLIESDVFDARLYRLNRAITWIDVQLPAAANGLTKLTAPSAEARKSLADLIGGEDPAKVIPLAEKQLLQSRLWLDLNRISAEALAKLGEKAAPAESAVKLETATLLRRLPGVEGLLFADNSPFADEATRKWLSQLYPASEHPPSEDEAADGDRAEAWRKIEALGAGGKLIEAARAVDALVRESASDRERLIARVRLCEIFVSAAAPIDARPYYEPLLEAVDFYHLEDFEPELAMRAMSIAFRGLVKAPDKEAAAKRRAELLKRIATISSSGALKLTAANQS
jgi:type VI secretion system protein VasJ